MSKTLTKSARKVERRSGRHRMGRLKGRDYRTTFGVKGDFEVKEGLNKNMVRVSGSVF